MPRIYLALFVVESLSRTRSPSLARRHMLSHGRTHTQVPMQSGAVKLLGVVMQPFTGQVQFGSQYMCTRVRERVCVNQLFT